MRAWAEYLAFLALKTIFFLSPRSWCLALGRFLGKLDFHLDRRRRRIALRNLKTAFGEEKRPEELRMIAKASFRNFGQIMADIFKLFYFDRAKIEDLVTVEGWENLTNAIGLGKGVLIFSAHVGNWELGSLMISRAVKLNVVARALDNNLMEEELVRFRHRMGAQVIYKQKAAREVLQALRRGEAVAILIDQNVLRVQAIFVDFFGRPAGTTPALGAFALRSGAPLVPVFCLPIASGRYRLKVLPPPAIVLDGDIETNVLKITRTCTKMIENEIRESPGAWLWFHDRWRSRPKEEKDYQNQTP
jgi:KDO2-lipid IV(A) lauroyltransferase